MAFKKRGALAQVMLLRQPKLPADTLDPVEKHEGHQGTVTEQRLYQLVRQPEPTADRHFEIAFLDSSVEAYCFTFG